MLRNMLYDALHPYMLHTHGIWQVTLRSLLEESMMHHTLYLFTILGFCDFFGADNGGGCDENMWIADRIAIVEW